MPSSIAQTTATPVTHEKTFEDHKPTLLQRLGRVQEFELIEIAQLSNLVLERMDKDDAAAPAGGNKAWVASQFRYPLRSWLIKANWNSFTFLGLSLLVIGGGFATSGITAAAGASKGSAAAWIIFAIGLIVAVVGGISQQFRFGVRANQRRALAVSLRAQGWRYVFKAGDYAGDGASAAFRAKVEELQNNAAQVGVIEGDTSAPSPPPSNGNPTKTTDTSAGVDGQPGEPNGN
ncbi:MAG: hypothetical protein JWO14_2831 [Solirubrobacterales bacterium]|nr:hypothetical protein [Solirubrobacterales bacterium]